MTRHQQIAALSQKIREAEDQIFGSWRQGTHDHKVSEALSREQELGRELDKLLTHEEKLTLYRG